MRNILVDLCLLVQLNKLKMHSPSNVNDRIRFELHVSALLKAVVMTAFFLFLGCSGAQAQESEMIKQLKAEANSGDYSAAHVLARRVCG